ncbi:hypothetical protein LTR66_001720 [Elasticomyces elasticus]|nr:hypothetical protein LTR66_001720 [Elasticomyces elasticus]
MALFSLFRAILALGLLYACYYVYWHLTTGARHRLLIAQNKCKPVQKYSTRNPLFSFYLISQNIKAWKSHKVLEISRSRFLRLGVNTFSVNILGRDIIITAEPEIVKTMQSLSFKSFGMGSSRKPLQPLLGQGIFTTDGAAWQHSRDMLRPSFHRSQVGDLGMFENHVRHLIDAVPRDGTTVNLADLFLRLTMDSATEFLFGESTNCLAPGINTVSNDGFAEAFNRAQAAIVGDSRIRFIKRLLEMKASEADQDIKYVHEFVDTYVRKGLAKRPALLVTQAPSGTKKRYIFLEELVRQTSDPLQIRYELLNILLAGRDTTAGLLTNVWWTLSKRPDIFARLRDEVDQLGGEPPTYEQLKDMKYVRAILNESLRLYPVVPSNSREAVEDTILPLGGGPDGLSPVFCPKGQVVVWSLYTMQRRKDFYGEDSEEFRPERWLGENGLRVGWEYLPFNGGPRVCLGQQLALTEASYATIRLMQEFQAIESRDPEDAWIEKLTLTCVGLNGAKVALTPYQ